MARVSARAVTGSMRNAGSDEKEDWLETESVSAPEDGGTPTLGKSRLTIRGNSLRLSVLRRRSLSASRPPNFQWENYARNLQPGIPPLPRSGLRNDALTARERRRRRLETDVSI